MTSVTDAIDGNNIDFILLTLVNGITFATIPSREVATDAFGTWCEEEPRQS